MQKIPTPQYVVFYNRDKNSEAVTELKLLEYMELINRIRDNQKSGMEIKTAVDAAVDRCIKSLNKK